MRCARFDRVGGLTPDMSPDGPLGHVGGLTPNMFGRAA
jgi:hypothetical protein